MQALIPLEAFAEMALMPAAVDEVVEPVARMFNHYTPTFNPTGMAEEYAKHVMKTRKMVQEDWVDALAEFPAWVIRDACKQWLYGEEGKFPPKIANIRKICNELMEPILKPVRVAEAIRVRQRRREELDAFFERQREARNRAMPQTKPLEINDGQ